MNDHLPAHVLEGLADRLWQERHLVESLLYPMVAGAVPPAGCRPALQLARAL